jgi:hypothetical protein
LFDDVGQEGAHNFVVDLIAFGEEVLAECKGLMCEHDKEEMELEGVELFFGFDEMVSGVVDELLEVEFHFIVPDEFKVDRVEDGVFGVVVFAEFGGFVCEGLEVLVAFLVGEHFADEFLDDAQQLQGFREKVADSFEKEFLALDCELAGDQVDVEEGEDDLELVVWQVQQFSCQRQGLNDQVVFDQFEDDDFVDFVDGGLEAGVAVFVADLLHGVHEAMEAVNVNL